MQRSGGAQLSATRQQKMDALMLVAAKQPVEEASEALSQLRTECEQINGQGGVPKDSQALHWLLGEGVERLGCALRRPELVGSTDPEAAYRVAALCQALLAAARDESQNPGQLLHVLRHLQPGAPACLRLLNLWFEDRALAANAGAECLALAHTTAELVDAATDGEGLSGGLTPLLRFLAGCRQRLQASSAAGAPEPALAAALTSAGTSRHAAADAAGTLPSAGLQSTEASAQLTAAAAALKRDTGAAARKEPDSWAAVLSLAAVALARLDVGAHHDDNASGGGGGGGSGNSSEDAAFAASMAAAGALLNWHLHTGGTQRHEDYVALHAIAAPLQYGSAYYNQQQQHLLRCGIAVKAAVGSFVAADPPRNTEAYYRRSRSGVSERVFVAAAVDGAGSSAGHGLAELAADSQKIQELVRGMYLLAKLTTCIAAALAAKEADLAAWPALQPWSDSIASCLHQLMPIHAYATGGPDNPTGRLVYCAVTKLLNPAQLILQVAMRSGTEALQQPTVALLMRVVPEACHISPAEFGLALQQFVKMRIGAAATACEAITAVAEAVDSFYQNTEDRAAGSTDRRPPWSPELLYSTCGAIAVLLRMSAADPDCGVWQQGAWQQQQAASQQQEAGAAPAGRVADSPQPQPTAPRHEPWHLLQGLAQATSLLQGALPPPAECLDVPEVTSALVSALAPPPQPHAHQRRRLRLAAGAAPAIMHACCALAALLQGSPAARRVVATEGFSDTWPSVVAALRQALAHEAAETQQALKAALQPVDDALSRQQQALGGEGAAVGSPPHHRRRHAPRMGTELPPRTAEGAEAAMRALLLEEEEEAAAAAAARSKATSPRQQRMQAKTPSSGAASASSTPAAAAGSAAVSADTAGAAGVTADAGSAADAGRPPTDVTSTSEATPAEPAAVPMSQRWMTCPITQEVMRDPVLCQADGQTYERAAITAWLQQHGTSPVNGAPAQTHSLLPNHTLRSMIEAARR